MKRPPLRALAAFEAAARHGSFWRAAKELHLTTSGVSHHIKALESFLGTKLFVRLNRGVQLTIEGTSFYEFVHEAYQRIDLGTQRILNRPEIELLTIRCGVSFGLRWLTPRLPLFLTEHSGIDLQILTPTLNAHPNASPVDIEIKYGVVDQPGALVEPLLEENILPMCSPSLLKGGRTLREPTELVQFRLIESEMNVVTWSSWLATNGIAISDFSRLRFDNIMLALQAASSGLGVALEGDFIAAEDLASGRLVVPSGLRKFAVRKTLRSLVVPLTRAKVEKVVLFRNWLFRMLEKG